MKEQSYTVVANEGMHARPASLLVKKASEFSSDINLVYNDKTVNLKSIMGVMSLGISKDTSFLVSLDGEDEEEALSALTQIIIEEGIAKS